MFDGEMRSRHRVLVRKFDIFKYEGSWPAGRKIEE
jgi:hypothetical protein